MSNAYQRHLQLVQAYSEHFKESKKTAIPIITDLDVLKKNHQFLWDSGKDPTAKDWKARVAKKYYDKLFKEYCLADLSRYKENKVAMRWRIEKEVLAGKGTIQ